MPRAGLAAATTYPAAFILPPHTIPSTLPCRQVPLGDDLLSRRETVNYDPFALYPGVIRNRNIAFIGDVGNGKSAAMKTFLERSLLLPERVDGTLRLRRAVIIDRKGEYKPLAKMFGCNPVVLGHGECLNPLDDRLTEQQHLAVVEAFLGLLMGRPLDGLEKKCVWAAYTQARKEGMLLIDVRRALKHLDDEYIAEIGLPRHEVDHAAIHLGLALDELLTGSQRGMFDGPTTHSLDWTGQVIDVVVHPDYLVSNRHLVYQLLVACVAVWLDQAWQAVDPAKRIDFFVCDEVWDLVRVRQFAEQLQEATKLGRSRGLCVLVAFHGTSDFKSAGNHGEAQVEMAERLLKDVDSFFLFRQSADDANLLRGIAKLSADDVELIQDLEPHTFMLVLGSGSSRHRFLVLHRLTDAEIPLVDSDRL